MIADFRATLGRCDVVFLTLDALRWDTACAAWPHTPNLAALIGAWEERSACGSFTLPAHEALFAGFFPTPPGPGPHPRRLAVRFPGSRSLEPGALVLDAPCVVRGYAAHGYHTICVGGTGFFDPSTPLGAALTARFEEVHWHRDLGVSARHSARSQLTLAAERVAAVPGRAFCFVNLSATHPPTRIYRKGATTESVDTQVAALVDIDRHLPVLLDVLRGRGAVGIVCADHGTCFGEEGHWGHRVAHPRVWQVPYGEFAL